MNLFRAEVSSGHGDSKHTSQCNTDFTPVKHRLVVLLLASSSGWTTELNDVEMYKHPQKVEERSCRHQDGKQVGQMRWRVQNDAQEAQTSHESNAEVELLSEDEASKVKFHLQTYNTRLAGSVCCSYFHNTSNS